MHLTGPVSPNNLHFLVLAPALSDVPRQFRQPEINAGMHERLIFDTQIVRGLALKECGPVGMELMPDGRHFQHIDAESWHILLQNGDGCILGCARYRPLLGSADQLAASHAALARSLRYGPVLRSVVDQLLTDARRRQKQCGEAGGWVLRREIRGSAAALNIALMTFALAEHLNCGLGITTATRMHHSAAMLCRLGARRVAELPAYYEPKYGSIIELLQFDLAERNPRYAVRLDKFRAIILSTAIICARKEAVRPLVPAEFVQPLRTLDSTPATAVQAL
jgi:hypothetical protein